MEPPPPGASRSRDSENKFWDRVVELADAGGGRTRESRAALPPAPKRPHTATQDDGAFIDADLLADRWFKLVFDGERQLHASNQKHMAHDILEDLCSRGVDWPDVELRRMHDVPGDEEPADLVIRSMKELSGFAEAEGTPIAPAPARKKDGPLWLIAEGASARVPDNLSIWGAIKAGPSRLHPITEGTADHLRFVGLVGAAVHGAAKHWMALKELGLAPTEWIDPWPNRQRAPLEYLNTSQALNARKWQKIAIDRATASGRKDPDETDFRFAWSEKPILKMSFEDFAETRAGNELLNLPPKSDSNVIWVDLDDSPGVAADDMAEADREHIAEVFEALGATGEFTKMDLAVMRVMRENFSEEQIFAVDPAFAREFGDISTFKGYVADLQDRVAEAIPRLGD